MPWNKEWGSSDLVNKDGKNFYHNVHTFTNRLQVVAQTRDKAWLEQSLNSCLYDETEQWWNIELDNIQRIGLIACGIKECCKALEVHFKPSLTKVPHQSTPCTKVCAICRLL